MSLLSKLRDTAAVLLTGAKPATPATPPRPESKPGPRAAAPAISTPGNWPLDRTLLHFYSMDENDNDVAIPYSLQDAYVGMFIFGATGSGKSSGSGHHLAAAWLRIGAGGLVLVAKHEEVDAWRKYAQEAGREDDLIVFGEAEQSSYNFLDYELAHSKGNAAEAATDVIMELLEASGRKGGGENDFWVDASRQLVANCLDLILLAGQQVSIRQIYLLATKDAAVDELLAKARARAEAGELTPSQVLDLDVARDYLAGEWRNMDEKPKSSVLMTASTLLARFQKGVLRDLFTASKSTHTPDDVLAGKIVVVDCAALTHHEAGRVANLIWKSAVQRAVQRRKATDESVPVFIFADECQHFLTRQDAKFVTTSRSYRTSMVYLTQNKSNVVERIGKDATEGFLGCFRTKIWHQQDDSSTNEWAATTVAKAFTTKTSTSRNFGSGGRDGGPTGGGGTSTQEVLEYQILPGEFLKLGTGGGTPLHGYVVTGYLFISGRVLVDGKTYAHIAFNQRKLHL